MAKDCNFDTMQPFEWNRFFAWVTFLWSRLHWGDYTVPCFVKKNNHRQNNVTIYSENKLCLLRLSAIDTMFLDSEPDAYPASAFCGLTLIGSERNVTICNRSAPHSSQYECHQFVLVLPKVRLPVLLLHISHEAYEDDSNRS